MPDDIHTQFRLWVAILCREQRTPELWDICKQLAEYVSPQVLTDCFATEISEELFLRQIERDANNHHRGIDPGDQRVEG